MFLLLLLLLLFTGHSFQHNKWLFGFCGGKMFSAADGKGKGDGGGGGGKKTGGGRLEVHGLGY